MQKEIDRILEDLAVVASERVRRSESLELASAVERIKVFQQRRFALTYADFLVSPRYSAAARFFLDELYGPGDFSRRDAQFARVVPGAARLFPRDVFSTVGALARLHALSERLDSAMGEWCTQHEITPEIYAAAWSKACSRDDRRRQLELVLQIGGSLDRLTRKPLVRNALHLMRGAAKLAGLEDLQAFLERGFDAFRAMKGAQEFLGAVNYRESMLMDGLFSGDESALTQLVQRRS